MKLHLCPFCGEEINIFIGDPCGSEVNGYTSINHVCDSGLSIGYFEHGQDYEKAEKALTKIIYLDTEEREFDMTKKKISNGDTLSDLFNKEERTCFHCGTVWEDKITAHTCPCQDDSWVR